MWLLRFPFRRLRGVPIDLRQISRIPFPETLVCSSINRMSTFSEVINFGRGQPDPSLLPKELIEEATIHRMRMTDNHEECLQYGEEMGNSAFRAVLSDFLTKRVAVPAGTPKYSCSSEQLFISNGSSASLDFCCRVLTKKGDTVAVEDPTYFLAKNVLTDHDVNVVGVPVDEHGIRVEKLDQMLSDGTMKISMLYTIPTYHNPCGSNLTHERRVALVECAQKHDFFIMADEVYQLLYFFKDNPPPPPLCAYEQQPRHVLSCGSFSKILAPGIRLAWIQGAPEIVRKFGDVGYLRSGGGLNPLVSTIVQSAIELGLLAKHIDYTCTTLKHRCKVMCNALRKYCPEVSFYEPQGGYFVWLTIPAEREVSKEFLERCQKEFGISFHPGYRFKSMEDTQKEQLRFSFAYYDEEKIEEGVRRFASALETLQ